MTDLRSNSGEAALTLEGRFPLHCRIIAPVTDELETAEIQAGAEETLKYLYSLEDHSPDGVDEHAVKPHELARIDLKLNYLLDMVGQMFARLFPVPESRQVKLHSDGLQWVEEMESGLHVGADVIVSLYLSSKCPKPVQLPGRVVSVSDEDAGKRIDVQFVGLTAAVQGWLDKLIFRHHRRAIALSRRSASSRLDNAG